MPVSNINPAARACQAPHPRPKSNGYRRSCLRRQVCHTRARRATASIGAPANIHKAQPDNQCFNPLCGFVCFGTAISPADAARWFVSIRYADLFVLELHRAPPAAPDTSVSIRYADLFVLELRQLTPGAPRPTVSIRYADLFVLEPRHSQPAAQACRMPVSIRYADLFVLEPVLLTALCDRGVGFNPLCGFVCFGTGAVRCAAAAGPPVSIRYADLFVLELDKRRAERANVWGFNPLCGFVCFGTLLDKYAQRAYYCFNPLCGFVCFGTAEIAPEGRDVIHGVSIRYADLFVLERVNALVVAPTRRSVSIRYADLFVLEPVPGASGWQTIAEFQSAMRICLFWNDDIEQVERYAIQVSIRYADLFVLEPSGIWRIDLIVYVSIRYADLFVLELDIFKRLCYHHIRFQSAMRICLFWNSFAPSQSALPLMSFNPLCGFVCFGTAVSPLPFP